MVDAPMDRARRAVVLAFVGYYLPGAKAGGILRSVENSVNHLHEDFDFKIVTRDRDLGDAEPYPNIDRDTWQSVGRARVLYLRPAGESLTRLRDIVNRTPHDVIRLNSFFDPFTVRVLVNRRLGRNSPAPVIVSPFGEFAWASLRQKYLKKTLFMWLARLTGLYADVTWHASSPIEAAEIVRVMKVSPAAIRVAEELPTPHPGQAVETVSARTNGELRVVFFSRVSPEKNLDYALNVLRDVRTPVAFDIIGPTENPEYWAECQKLVPRLPPHVTVRALGSIGPAEVITTLARYDVFLLPTGGEAYGHVIAESLTAGTPVLISTNTPWRGLEAEGLGWDVPLDDAARFVQVIDELGATDPAVRLKRRKTIKEKAERLLADPARLESNRQLYLDALASRRPAES